MIGVYKYCDYCNAINSKVSTLLTWLTNDRFTNLYWEFAFYFLPKKVMRENSLF